MPRRSPISIAGAALLAEDCWERRHELIFALELHRAECEFLTGALADAEERLAALSTRAATTVERATVACLRMDLYTTLDQSGRAVAVGLDYLRHLGIDWSPHPTEEEVRREYERIWSQLGEPADRGAHRAAVDERPGVPRDPRCSDQARAAGLVYGCEPGLPWSSAERSISASSAATATVRAVAYVMLGMVAGPRFGDYQAGFRFGQLGYDLVERRGLKRFQARTYH